MLDTGLKILLISSEVAPFAKTGGLADVAGSLPKALLLQGNDIRVVLPRYRSIPARDYVADFPVQVGDRKETCIVRSDSIEAKSDGVQGRIPVYFIDNYHYFDRERYYVFPDEAERFAFFDRACLQMCEALDFIPDVVHCNDWQSGFVPLLVRLRGQENHVWRDVATVYTIHNLKYQGRYPREVLAYLGVGPEYFHQEGVEFYGDVSFMKAGIVYSDVVNTVSETYAREIQTPSFGEGFEGILRKRGRDLYGIVNGINYHEFNPASDPRIYATYDASTPAKKKENKHALQRELNLEVSNAPLMGMVSRLVDQKGLDILRDALPSTLSGDAQFVLLGTGDGEHEMTFRQMASKYPGKMAAIIGFNGVLAQRIYAGADLFLMPSRFEPCGLGQLIAMRYGTIPVARRTGGLADTVIDYDPNTGTGNGFSFSEYSAKALAGSIRRALAVFKEKDLWWKLVSNTMNMDFSWNRSAAMYTELYLEALGRRGRVERPA